MKNNNSGAKCLVQYGDVFKKEVNRNLYRRVSGKEKLFTNSEIVNDTLDEKYKEWRRSKVLYNYDLKDFEVSFKKFIRKNFKEICGCLNVRLFKIAKIDIQLTSHNDEEHFKLHSDTGTVETNNRVITFVYYFHSPVKKFSGGELLFPQHGIIKVEPVNNTIIFFNSALWHEVLPVSCPGKKFKDGRFTVNGWILKKGQDKVKAR